MSPDDLRLLPWPGPDGQRAYLLSGEAGGTISRLADLVEDDQLDRAAKLLGHVRHLVKEPNVSDRELWYVVGQLTECLADALQVAESRGDRLAVADDEATP